MIDAWPKEKWVPDSCCDSQHFEENCGKRWPVGVFSKGCYSQIHNFFVKRLDIIGVVGIVIGFIQVRFQF